MESAPKTNLPQKSADDLRYLLAQTLGIDSESRQAKTILIVPMNDSWRAMSGFYDDNPEFRNDVIRRSIELAEQYNLES